MFADDVANCAVTLAIAIKLDKSAINVFLNGGILHRFER